MFLDHLRSCVPHRVDPWAYRVHRALRPAVRAAVWGRRRSCNVCGSTCRRFLSHGSVAEAVCPVCLSHGRHRIAWKWLERHSGLDRGEKRLLHLAPEPELTRRLRHLSNLRVISGDLGSPLAELRVDVTRLGLMDRSFDAVICSHVLEHVPCDSAAIAELYRILRPGGWLMVQVPLPSGRLVTDEDPSITSPSERARRFGQADHLRLYGMDIVDRLRREGFEVDVLTASDLFDPRRLSHHCLRLDEPLFVARRPKEGSGATHA